MLWQNEPGDCFASLAMTANGGISSLIGLVPITLTFLLMMIAARGY